MTDSLYEQLKDDLGYLGLQRSAECFALLAEEAKAGEWSHVEYLARVIGEQANATLNRKLAARLRFARFPFRRTLADFDFSVPTERGPQDDRRPGHLALHRREPPGPLSRPGPGSWLTLRLPFIWVCRRVQGWPRSR